MAVDLAQKAQNFTNRGRQALETGRAMSWPSTC